MKAILALADGTAYEGTAFGAEGETSGEVVFNTGMTGYQEVLTDPSYAGQIVTLTYPLIGNYGVNRDDIESRRIQVAGFVVRELADVYSNWRADESLGDFLKSAGVLGISGVDTRAITRRLRSEGVMRGIISTQHTKDELWQTLAEGQDDYDKIDWVKRVTTPNVYNWGPEESEAAFRVSVLDCGVKYNILRELARLGIRTTVYPATATAEEMLADDPDGVFLSPGPGDPRLLDYAVTTVREIIASSKAGYGHLFGKSVTRMRGWGRNLQTSLRTPGSQPPGKGHPHRSGRHHQSKPRVCPLTGEPRRFFGGNHPGKLERWNGRRPAPP